MMYDTQLHKFPQLNSTQMISFRIVCMGKEGTTAMSAYSKIEQTKNKTTPTASVI